MKVIDGIAYASEVNKVIQVISARAIEDYKLWLRFSTGEEKIFDFLPLLDEKVYSILKDKSVFSKVYVDYGVTVWNDGEVDIAPEYLYHHGIPS